MMMAVAILNTIMRLTTAITDFLPLAAGFACLLGVCVLKAVGYRRHQRAETAVEAPTRGSGAMSKAGAVGEAAFGAAASQAPLEIIKLDQMLSAIQNANEDEDFGIGVERDERYHSALFSLDIQSAIDDWRAEMGQRTSDVLSEAAEAGEGG